MTTDDDKQKWLVLTDGSRDVEIVPADRVSVNAGALVFEDGPMLNANLVVAYGVGDWNKVLPYDGSMDCDHDHSEDE